jgi:hypothetical protein
MATQSTCLFKFESAAASYIPLWRDPDDWNPLIQLILQYDIGPSYNFLTNLLGVDTEDSRILWKASDIKQCNFCPLK